jgi:hypothetical protein
LAISAYWNPLRQWCSNAPPFVRRVAEMVLRARGRLHLARFDQRPAGRCQMQALLGLVHQARSTPFGLDHDFHRIRTVADFRRLVPVCSPLDPGRGPGRPDALLPALRAAQRRAWRTALALVHHARPKSPLLAGRLVFLGADVSPESLPLLPRPFSSVVPTDALRNGWAGWLTRQPVTCLAGPARHVLQLCDRVKQITRQDRIAAVWPGLVAVLHSGQPADVARLRQEMGQQVLLETVFRPEGPVAVEDPRAGLPRLLTDHGVFFEFLPGADRDPVRPCRLGLEEIEPGVSYELALTSPAGLWACRVGLTVRFERRDPPLLRLVPVAPPTRSAEQAVTFPAQPPHRQSAGSPAGLPGTPVHSPWSIPAGPG